jgi:N-acetylglucosaminyldiphosphoundecaprenol N-acetyl-beta-D-mannosaminyltransferase
MQLKHLHILTHRSELNALPDRKLVINTINAHSHNVAQKDALFAEALMNSDVLIPDGAGVVKAVQWLKKVEIERITGWDLFAFEMERLNQKGGVCFFLGSSVKVLELILRKTAKEYTNVRMIGYSPRYRNDFTEEENLSMLDEIHAVNPDLIMIGMTAPKQEKWSFLHRNQLNVNCHICAIGAVFDFYAGTLKRAPVWWQEHSLEWLYRLIMEPRRMWKRYIIGNFLFIYYILKEKYFLQQKSTKRAQPVPVTCPHKEQFTNKEAPSPTKNQVQKKAGSSNLRILLVAVLMVVGGFFLYPIARPMFLSENTKEITLNNGVTQTPNDTAVKNPVSTPETELQPEAVAQSHENLGTGRYVLIVKSFPTRSLAEEHGKNLQEQGIPYEIIDAGNRRFRVSIASFDTKAEADRYALEIKSRQYCENVWVTRR